MTTFEIDHHVPVPRLSSNAQRRERILRSSILGGFLLIAILIFSLEAAAAEFGPVPNAEVNKARAALGKRLFFDSRLSGDTGRRRHGDGHVPKAGRRGAHRVVE